MNPQQDLSGPRRSQGRSDHPRGPGARRGHGRASDRLRMTAPAKTSFWIGEPETPVPAGGATPTVITGSRLESLDLPAGSIRRVAESVVEAVLPVLPEFEYLRLYSQPPPPRRAGHLVSDELGLDTLHLEIQ